MRAGDAVRDCNTKVVVQRGAVMTQDEINQSEWANPDNWHGPKWISIYSSSVDTRRWVPKQIPWMGLWLSKATPNFAHSEARIGFGLIMLGILGLLLGILFHWF